MATLAPPPTASHIRSNSSPTSTRPQLKSLDSPVASPTRTSPTTATEPRKSNLSQNKPKPADQMPQKGALAKRSKNRAMSDPSPAKPKLFGLFKKSDDGDTEKEKEKKRSKKDKNRERRDSVVRFVEEPDVIPYFRRGDSWLSTIIEHPESPAVGKKFWSR